MDVDDECVKVVSSSCYSKALSLFINMMESESGVMCISLSGKPKHSLSESRNLSKVRSYLDEGSGNISSIQLDIRGTDFQERVWRELRKIPSGELRTYGEIAARLGVPGGARAVGGAVAANNLPLLIPCHRVVASEGLGGFSAYGGLKTKKKLLEFEDSFRRRQSHGNQLSR